MSRRVLWIFLFLPLCGWAQAPCNDTVIRLRDTICEGTTYAFGGRQLTYSGVYYDTLPRRSADCDSIVILTLSVLPTPMVQFFTQNICRGDVGYTIVLGSDGSWFRWSASPPDPDLESQLQGRTDVKALHVNPQRPTTYSVYADYSAQPMCPDSGRVDILPLVPVTAKLYVSPAEISVDNLELFMVDQSVGNGEAEWGYYGRTWMLNGEQINRWGQEERLRLQLPPGDSLRVTLFAYNYSCSDSAVAVLPVRRDGLYFPNAFMPGAREGGSLQSRSLFAPVAVGIAECEIWIYDRRGTLVHHAVDARQGWDGRCGGVGCPQGVYAYRCRYRETAYSHSDLIRIGTVLLIR